jgi:hypothetical protein
MGQPYAESNLDTVVSKPNSPTPPANAMRPIAILKRHWDFLAVLLLMAASLPLSWVSPRTVILVQHPGTFDDNWVLDSAFKASRGMIFGRDVAFVYGPVFHWLMAAPARWPHYSMGATYVGYRTLLLWCTFLFGYGTLRLLLPEQSACKRFLLLLLLAVFWVPWDGRTAFAIFLFALFLRGWYAVQEERLRPLVFSCGSALLIALAFLYSADTGVYGIAAWVLGLAGVAWEGRSESRKFAGYAVAAGGFAVSLGVLVLVINAIMAAPLEFRFWRTSLALVAVHRWNEPFPISGAGAMHLLTPVVIGACLFLVRLAVPPDRDAAITARTGFLLSAFLFALLSLQSGLVRSDYNHIVFGAFPMVFFAGAVLFSFQSRVASVVAALGAVVCSVVLSQPAPHFRPASLRFRLARTIHPISTCPGGYRELDHACYPSEFANTLGTTVGYLKQHSGEQDSVLIFPYQYMFAVAAERNVAAGVEQSFLANGPYLSQFDIAGMESAKAQAGFYFPDAGPTELTSPTLSLPIDDVSNFTRTPDIWFWIFRHYRSDGELAPGILALQWDDSRQSRISMQEYPLAVAARDFPIPEPSTTIDLGAPEWPPSGADFLRLRMTIRYSPLWKLRKPERLQLEITLADGSRSVRTFVVEPNVATDVWFYPWNEADLSRYFDGDENRWRASYRPAVTDLRLLITPLDWFSQKPESVVIESADAVRFGMKK